MKNITIILPLHKLTDDYKLMFNNAVSSIEDFHENVKLLVVTSGTIESDLSDLLKETKVEYKLLVNSTNDLSFPSQINLGIDNVDTEWFSILEVDDTYHSMWLRNMNDYIKHNEDVDVFLPIVKDINVEGKFVNFMNESAWAYGFCNTQGFLDNEVLMEYQNYQTSGGLYRTTIIKNLGKLKENIKLTFTYEFLLRLTHNNIKVMVTPKVGYIHVNYREDSLYWNYKNSDEYKLTEDEVKFWIDSAKKEFFFTNKRELVYEMT